MKITQLLTKNQQVQFTVFEYFLHHSTKIGLKELTQEIHVSLPTLQKELVALQLELQAYDPKASLKKNVKDDYHLRLPPDFSVKGFLNHYLQQGLDYQLIYSIFYQKNISITKMMLDLQISEASIFRRFKAINYLLEEFRIQIKNKKMIGDENQIRFFFFHFFWQSQSLDRIQMKMNPLNSQHLIQILETYFQRNFSREEYWKLVLWFEIMSRRFDYREEQTKEFSGHFFEQLDEDETFQQLKNILARYLSRFAYQSFDNEAVYLYLFLLAEGIYLPVEEKITSSLLLNIFTTNQKIREVILKNQEPVIQTEAFLYALHSRVAFYQGGFNEELSEYHRLLSDGNPQKLNQCMTIVENQLARHLTNTQWHSLDRNYGFLLELYQKEEEIKSHIGVALDCTLETKSYLAFLQKELGIFPNIDIEMANQETYYQLLIVDEFTEQKNYLKVATLMTTKMCTPFEIQRIQEALNQG